MIGLIGLIDWINKINTCGSQHAILLGTCRGPAGDLPGMNGQRLSQGKCPKASSPPTCQSLEIHSRHCIGRCVSESSPEPYGWALGGRCVFNMFPCRRKAKLGAALKVRESQPKPKAFSPPGPRVIFLEHHKSSERWVWRKCKSRHRPRLASLRWGDLTGRHKQPWGWVARRRAQPK